MRLSFRTAGLLFAIAGVIQAQNATVLNAASVQTAPPALVNPFFSEVDFVGVSAYSNIVSPGMMAILHAPAPGATANPLLRGRPAPSASETTISIRHSGSSLAIPLEILSVNATSITFVIPLNMPLGGAEIEYQFAGQPTGWTNVNVVPASFAFFTNLGGPVIAQSVAADGSLSPIGLTTPAQPGQTIRITGSGLGYNTPVSVTVGGVPATVVSPPPHRATPGIDEIWFQIPAGSAVTDGCYVPLVLSYSSQNQWSQMQTSSTISKTSTGAPCVHPFQLSVADMATLDSGGYIAVGQIDMSTTLDVATASAASRDEYDDLNPTEMTAGQIASLFLPTAPGCSIGRTSTGGFAYLGQIAVGNASLPTPPDLGSAVLQNGATTLNFSGTLPQTTEGPLSAPPTPAIAGGTWTWQTSGSTDLATSSFNFTLPAPFQLSGATPPSFIRTQDQTLNWNGAAFDAGAVLTAFLNGSAATGGQVSLDCTVPANSGTLTIPATMLSQLAGSSLDTLNILVRETGSFIPHAQLKLTSGATLLMYVSYSTGENLPVDVQ